MTGFGDDMKAQLAEFRKAQEQKDTAKTPKAKSQATYECEASGIDLVVSRVVNGRCTMKLFVYLSQTDESGQGTIFIKTMKDGSMKPATEDNIASFLRELGSRSVRTTSDAIPEIRGGKEFARALLKVRAPDMTQLIKEGLLNTDLLEEERYILPWYAKSDGWYCMGNGVKDRHAKLIRHMVSSIAARRGAGYSSILCRACSRGSTWDREGNGEHRYIWAFSVLADAFDEPYAQRCFDEYLDNERLSGLDTKELVRLITDLAEHDDEYSVTYPEAIRRFRVGEARVTLEKNRFWEFLQHAVAVGMGAKLDDYISLYRDYLLQALKCDGKVRDKYPDYLQVAHDVYSEKSRLIAQFREQEGLRRAIGDGEELVDRTHGGYELRMLTDVNAFLEEARQNCNCVASYVSRVAAGKCWIASFRPVGSASTLLTVEIDPKDGMMVQVKGRYNREPTEAELEALRPFQEELCRRVAAKRQGEALPAPAAF